ncbi:MAG: 23S rRNA (guanosine(2251)-2'-O)-methyltransferase RlmB [Spirochaetales bacterium]|nr:23S rRNA (guanosine(2251)-2'-O)-methyltransferase RlmB [Spirochaetales bacterium]
MAAQFRVISAFHAIEEKTRQQGTGGELLYCRINPRIEKILQSSAKSGISQKKVSQAEIDKLAGAGSHRGIVLIVRSGGNAEAAHKIRDIETLLESLDKQNPLVVVLDGITDPHNLGAVLRSADQFAADCVIVPDVRSAGGGSIIDQTSAGANMYVPLIRVKNISREIKTLQQDGFWVYGAAMDGKDAGSVALTGKIALVLGSEGKGLHELVAKNCDELVRIPCSGNIDSLNVSVAAGILMYECRRQQGFTYT